VAKQSLFGQEKVLRGGGGDLWANPSTKRAGRKIHRRITLLGEKNGAYGVARVGATRATVKGEEVKSVRAIVTNWGDSSTGIEIHKENA